MRQIGKTIGRNLARQLPVGIIRAKAAEDEPAAMAAPPPDEMAMTTTPEQQPQPEPKLNIWQRIMKFIKKLIKIIKNELFRLFHQR